MGVSACVYSMSAPCTTECMTTSAAIPACSAMATMSRTAIAISLPNAAHSPLTGGLSSMASSQKPSIVSIRSVIVSSGRRKPFLRRRLGEPPRAAQRAAHRGKNAAHT